MAGESGETIGGPVERVPKPQKRTFFINGRLVRLLHVNRPANMVYIYDYIDKAEKIMLLSDWKKHRKRAYTPKAAAKILNRSKSQMKRYYMTGMIKRPTTVDNSTNGAYRVRSYFSEDDLFEIRAVMATIHRGQPRKDGRITPSKVLTEQELRAKLGDALLLYTKKEDGTFVPVWAEETY